MYPSELLERLIESLPANMRERGRRFVWSHIERLFNSTERLQQLLQEDLLDRQIFMDFMMSLYEDIQFMPVGEGDDECPKTPEVDANSQGKDVVENLAVRDLPDEFEGNENAELGVPLTPGDSDTTEPLPLVVKLPLKRIPKKSKIPPANKVIPVSSAKVMPGPSAEVMPGPSTGRSPSNYRPPPTEYLSSDDECEEVNGPSSTPKLKGCSVKLHPLSPATLERLGHPTRRRSRSSSTSSSSSSTSSFHSDCSGCIRENEELERKTVGLKHPKSSEDIAKVMRNDTSLYDLVYPSSDSDTVASPPPVLTHKKLNKKSRPTSSPVSDPPAPRKVVSKRKRCIYSSSSEDSSPPRPLKVSNKNRPYPSNDSNPSLKQKKVVVTKPSLRIVTSSDEGSLPPKKNLVKKSGMASRKEERGAKGAKSPPPQNVSGVGSSGEPIVNKKLRLKTSTRHVETPRQSSADPIVPDSSDLRPKMPCAVPAKKKSAKKADQEKPKFKCPHCEVTCNRKDNLDRHVKAAHTRRELFFCPVEGCKVVYTREASLIEHIPRHDKNPPTFKCRYCAAQFDSRQKRNAHESNPKYACYKKKLARKEKEMSKAKKRDDKDKKKK